MTHDEKIQWMAVWASKNRVTLDLEGECGIGRECVGVIANQQYPSYEWRNDEYDRIDNNGEVWCPPNAYHKHPCVAVLGRGEEAENQLYDWLKWFDENNFKIETGINTKKKYDPFEMLLGQHLYARIVKQQ